MRVLTHTVIEAEAGQPVKQLLLHLWGISGSFLSRLKFRQAITVNGAPVTVRFVPRPGDVLAADISDLPGEHPHIRPVDFPLDILYEDEDLLLINKPAGIAVHPAALTEETATIAGAAAHYLHSESFHAVNRLDRGTTGVMAVAKTGFIHARCMAMLHTDDFRREYRAVCEGIPSPAEGDIDLPIGRAESSLLKRQADPLGQPAHTHYEVLAASQGRALLRLTPTTGRTHQLRVHMAAIGHPLTGDWLYGTEDRALIARPALHSYHLRMMHPLTGTTIDVTAPLPEDIQRLLKEERL
ncbi:MAG: RluA family pseudouridine synthase [Clostridiales bacterium]|nr:RluA family pseudouridine synthase [Clostridiales bacterium]